MFLYLASLSHTNIFIQHPAYYYFLQYKCLSSFPTFKCLTIYWIRLERSIFSNSVTYTVFVCPTPTIIRSQSSFVKNNLNYNKQYPKYEKTSNVKMLRFSNALRFFTKNYYIHHGFRMVNYINFSEVHFKISFYAI